MTAIDKINLLKNYINNFKNNIIKKDKTVYEIRNDNFTKKEQLDKVTYDKLDSFRAIDAVKRPIKIDNSNNTFFINHNNENKTVKIKAGEYNLTELSLSIQKKVNEKFGIGKVKLELTASASDRLIYAEDKSKHTVDQKV